MAALVVACLAPAAAAQAEPAQLPAKQPAQDAGWRPLFDGETLDGWHQLGGKAKFHVEDGEIVGTTVPREPNSFLATDRGYGDFELELELRVDPLINSGVQIRSHVRDNGRVFGMQVEIDPSDRSWSAGIYDEARRGWLNDLKDNAPAREAFRRDGWNRYRILCVGDSIRTWVNGVPAADLVDSVDLEGFIALQVHGVGKAEAKIGKEVRWRNIRIRDLGKHVWQPLWNGDDLSGFTPRGGGAWRVEDGVLVGTSPASEPRHGVLLSAARFGDFTARLAFRAVDGNSGFYFRCEPVDGPLTVRGFQAEMDPSPDKHTGGLYETGGRAWVVQPVAKDVGFKAGDWNRMTVSARGRRVTVHLNDRRSAEVRDDPGAREGHLGLQLHGGQDMRVEVRALEILRPVSR